MSLTEIGSPNFGIKVWIRNYIHAKMWVVITYPCSNYDGGLAKTQLKFDMDKIIEVIMHPYHNLN